VLGGVIIALALALGALWGGEALWLRLPLGDFGRGAVAAAFVAVQVVVAVLLWKRRVAFAMAVLAVSWAGLLGWWSTILPSNNRIWTADMAHVADARIDGDVLTVDNVRNFHWRSETDFDARWETRRYNLSQLVGADLFLSYWAGESLAHAIVSFDFADSEPLAFSIEIRKEKGESYSSTAGFFKTYELAIIAADERDIVKVRSVVRGEDVRLYRLDIQQRTALGLLKQYAAVAADVSATPRWYNTLTANCTTVIFGMARRLDPNVVMDWRILLPGKLPSYLRDYEFVSRAVSLEALVAAAKIDTRAEAPFPDPDFSRRIRARVPDPAGVPKK